DCSTERGPGTLEGLQCAFALTGDGVVAARWSGTGLLPAGLDPPGPAQAGQQRVQGALPTDQHAVLSEAAGDVSSVGRTVAQRGEQAVLEHSAPQVREDGILARYHASQGTWRGDRQQPQASSEHVRNAAAVRWEAGSRHGVRFGSARRALRGGKVPPSWEAD